MRDYGKDSAQDDKTNIQELLNVLPLIRVVTSLEISHPALSRHNAFDSAAETQALMMSEIYSSNYDSCLTHLQDLTED